MGDGWDAARTLHERQHKKCAYCEAKITKPGFPVEHFRPRQGVDPRLRDEPARAKLEDRYWWLAWTWENVFFSCASCNGKGVRFPLLPGATTLAPPPRAALTEADFDASFDLSLEDAARSVVDPSVDDPQAHLTWRPWINGRHAKPSDPFHEIDWRPEGLTERGWNSVVVFKFADDSKGATKEAVNDEITSFYKKSACKLVALLKQGAPHWKVSDEWSAVCAWLGPEERYSFAKRCVVDFLFRAQLTSLGLWSSLPPLTGPSPRAARRPVFEDGLAAGAFARVSSLELRMRIRAGESRESLQSLLDAETNLDDATRNALF